MFYFELNNFLEKEAIAFFELIIIIIIAIQFKITASFIKWGGVSKRVCIHFLTHSCINAFVVESVIFREHLDLV